MQINIYKDKLLGARLFGASVLYSVQPIPREDVPQGWYCYDLRGTARHPDEPYALVDQAEDCHAGSVLSYLPLKSGRSQKRLVKDMFRMLGTNPTLAEFCAEGKIRCPETPLRYMMGPASPEDAGLFYAQMPERDEELGTIGHVRIDFGSSGKAFHHSWWPRGPEELNTQEFRDELDKVVNDLRKGLLKDLSSMRRCCYGGKGAIEGGACCQNYGFTLETDRYLYRLRCNPTEGDYQAYLGCFIKREQQLGLTEKGRQMLQEAADPSKVHSYSWYVIENLNDPTRRIGHELPLEDVIHLYASLDCEDKRLGVTKDGIAAVDLVIRWEGCEWLSKDRLAMDGFKNDPVVADAVDQLQQTLRVDPLVGRVTFASGETENFTDPQKYLQTVREELPYDSATNSVYIGEQPTVTQPAPSGTVTIPTDGSRYIPQAGDRVRCDDGYIYEVKDVSRYDSNVFAEGPVGELPTPTCDWSTFPDAEIPKVEVRHFAHDTGDSMFIRNLYETRRMQYTIYNALGKEPGAWRDGRPLASVQLTIDPADEPYTQTFWPWRTSELENLVYSRPNSRYYVEAWDYYSKGVFQYTRYCVVSF